VKFAWELIEIHFGGGVTCLGSGVCDWHAGWTLISGYYESTGCATGNAIAGTLNFRILAH
jgi:hypothetical protein